MKYPCYLNLSKKEWEERIGKAWSLLNPCRVCPRECRVNRVSLKDKKFGFCRVGSKALVSSSHPHFGEERCLVGTGGSGTIFFASCNLACVYCQNYEISQLRLGREVEVGELAKMMIHLQDLGCHNINFVSPTIWAPQILKSLPMAINLGLKLPLVYNTGGYDSVEALKLLDGIVDIYMPDMKYADVKTAQKYSLVPNYWQVNKKAVAEMYRQVGDLVIEDGVAKRGLLVRHLVLPNGLAGTKKTMAFLAKEISKNTYVNIMAQYYPCHKASRYPAINRRITSQEYQEAVNAARKSGLWRLADLKLFLRAI